MTNREHDPLHVAVLVGSVRQGRFAPVIARWFARLADTREGMTFDFIDLAETRLPADMPDPPPPEVQALGERLAAADAFVVITPEYNHSFPASLKNAIDWFGSEWHRKPVGFVSYGGVSGGLRAVEQLRLVFAELQAMTVRDAVSFHGAQGAFDADGHPRNNAQASRSAGRMLDQLAWWGRALREARAKDAIGEMVAVG